MSEADAGGAACDLDESDSPAHALYRSLVESAPDAILVADAETGVIVEANVVAERLLGKPREEIVGTHQTELHPPESARAYRELFEHHVEAGGTFRRLLDGRQVYVVDDDGDRIPVEISAGTVRVGDARLVHGVFRDVRTRCRYERSLATVHDTARELLVAETTESVQRLVIDAATEVLPLETVAIYTFDVEAGVLRPAARSTELDLDLPRLQPGESAAWRAFSEGTLLAADDVTELNEDDRIDLPIRSALLAPLGEHGVLFAVDPAPAAYDERDVELANTLAAMAAAALDRVDRAETIRARDRALRRRNERLERVEELNAVLRRMDRTVVEADSRAAVERAVCEQLRDVDSVVLAWIGALDRQLDRLAHRSSAGADRGYLGEIDRAIDTGSEVAVRAARTRETQHVSNVAGGLPNGDWQDEALARGFRSALAVPLVYRDVCYGVLAVYGSKSSTFDGPVGKVLDELGGNVAHAIAAIDRRDALVDDRTRVLEFEIADRTCFLARIARRLDETVDLEGVSPREDGSVAVVISAEGVSAERLESVAVEDSAVDEARRVGDLHGAERTEVVLSGPFVGTVFADHGFGLRSASADGTTVRAVLTVSRSTAVRHVVEVVSSRFPDATLRAAFDADGPPDGTAPQHAVDRLTERQREVATLAYRAGYFERTRESTGAALAETLDISPSAFHRHLREAERKLFDAALGRDERRTVDPSDDEGTTS